MYQCKIIIHRLIQSCAGWFNYIKPSEGAEVSFLMDISPSECEFIHNPKIFKYDNVHTIAGLRENETVSTPITYAGSASSGKCTGGSYSDHFGTFDDVLVQGYIKITLTKYIAKVDIKNNKTMLRSGTVCALNDGYCIDMQDGHTFWNTIPKSNSLIDNYEVIFQGVVTRVENFDIPEIMYMIDAEDVSFALKIIRNVSMYNFILKQTEHPKLLIIKFHKDAFIKA